MFWSVRIAVSRPEPDRARLVLRELLDRPDDMRGRLAISVRPWVAMIADYIRKGQKSGEVHADADPEAYVVDLIAMVLTSFATAPVLGTMIADSEPSALLERQRREILRLARAGLFAEGEPFPEQAPETR